MAHPWDKTGVTHTDTIEIVRASTGDDDNLWWQIKAASVGTTQLTNSGVTLGKMANLAANTLIGSIAGGTPEAITCTSAGRAILDDADADAQLATLGGGAPLGTGVLVRASALGTFFTDEAAQDAVGLIFQDTSTIDFTYNDAGAVISAAVIDASITLAKMANLAQDQMIIRTTASTGVPETAPCTAAARTVLDDTTVGAMVNTLFGATSTGTGGAVRAAGGTFAAAEGTFDNGGLHILDTNGSHDLIITPGSDLTADRVLTITTGDAARTLTISGNTTLSGGTHSGTNTGDQTITLTGHVTGTGTGSFATTIAANTVTLAMQANVATETFSGRATASTGSPETLTLPQANNLLGKPTAFTYNANKTLDLSTAVNWQMSDTMTGNMALTLTNGVDGSNGVIAIVQDGTGNRLISGCTVSGRTVKMDPNLGSSINTTAMKAANAVSIIGYTFFTVNGTAYVQLTLMTAGTAGFT